ncbi:MAG: ATP-binding protein [Bacteroidota bacterium]
MISPQKIVLGSLLLLLASFCYSQSPIFGFHHLGTEQGLSNTDNAYIYTDKDGFTWISSLDGANRFDGKEVEVFKENRKGLIDFKGVNILSSFFEDDKENIWFTTGAGIISYSNRTGRFSVDYARREQDSVVAVHHAFYLEKNRYLWVAAYHALFRYDTYTKTVRSFPEIQNFDMPRVSIETNGLGEIIRLYAHYRGTQKGKIRVIEFSSSLEVTKDEITFFDLKNEGIEHYKTIDIVSDANGYTFFLTDKGLIGVNSYCTDIQHFFPFPKGIHSIQAFEKVGDELWLVGEMGKLFKFDLCSFSFAPESASLIELRTRDSISNIQSIYLNKDSILWLAVEGQGVYYSNIRNSRLFSAYESNTIELSTEPISTIMESAEGSITALTESGKARIFSSSGKYIGEERYPKYFQQIQMANGDSWAISNRGIGKSKPDSPTFDWKYSELAQEGLLDIASVNQDMLLISSFRGLYLLDVTRKHLELLKENIQIVEMLHDSNGRLWSGTTSAELTVWDINLKEPSVNRLKRWTKFGTIHQIVEDQFRNLVWIATSKGLLKVDASDEDFQVTQYDITDGLPSSNIQSIAISENQQLWIATNKGICNILNPSDENFIVSKLSQRDGLSSNEFFRGVSLVASDGTLWFGSSEGADMIDPKGGIKGSEPELAIKSIKIHDKEWIDSLAASRIQSLCLSYQQNSITIKMAAMEYTDPTRNYFKVYLEHEEGIDSSLIEKINSVTYPYLPPGSYTFRFTACNAYGKYQQNEKILDIKILPPYYQTWWFRLLVFLSIVALISLGIIFYYRDQLRSKELELEKQQRISDRKQQKLEKELALRQERERIADDMHDELGLGLSSIRNRSERALRGELSSEAFETLNRVKVIAYNLRSNMRDIIWAINPENDSLKKTIARVRANIALALRDNALKASIDIQRDLPDVSLNSKVKSSLLLVTKEIIHNIVKYAGASQVALSIRINKNNLEILVEDDGCGFEPGGKEYSGNGIKSIKKRMKSIAGSIRWEKKSGHGTLVSIVVPVAPI